MGEPAGTATLRRAAELIEGATLDVPMVAADRDALHRMARRLRELADGLDAPAPKPAPAVNDLTPAPELPERLLTSTEAAARLGVHVNTLANWRKRGLLLPRADGRGWHRYGAAELRRGLAILAGTPPDELPPVD